MFLPTLPPLLPFLLLLHLDGLGAVKVQYRRKIALNGVTFRQTQHYETLATSDRRQLIVLDLLMMVDYSLYDSFLTLSGGDSFSAEFAIRDYINAIFDQVHSLYRVVEVMGFRIELKLAGIFIALRPEDSPLSVNGTAVNSTVTDAVQAVADIKSWILTYARWLPSHDHAAVITKLDMQLKNDSSTQGMAYIGSICKLGDSASLTEDIGGMATAVIVAHELAHRNSTNQTVCLFESSERRITKKSLKEVETKKPGEKIDLNRQCSVAFGENFRYCKNPAYLNGDICQRLWCKNVTQKRHEPCETKGYLPMLDGTVCAEGMWCIKGKCEPNPKADEMSCPNGDLNPKVCSSFTKAKLRHFCKSKQYVDICCSTCKSFRN